MSEGISKGTKDLAKTETKIEKSERRVVLFCYKCNKHEDLPVCEDCDELMELEDDQFHCIECEDVTEIPTCCGKRMTIKIV